MCRKSLWLQTTQFRVTECFTNMTGFVYFILDVSYTNPLPKLYSDFQIRSSAEIRLLEHTIVST